MDINKTIYRDEHVYEIETSNQASYLINRLRIFQILSILDQNKKRFTLGWI
jgi:hypothetical protein